MTTHSLLSLLNFVAKYDLYLESDVWDGIQQVVSVPINAPYMSRPIYATPLTHATPLSFIAERIAGSVFGSRRRQTSIDNERIER